MEKQKKINVKKLMAIILMILVVTIIILVVQKNAFENNIEYEITKVNEYNYFVLIEEEKYGVINKTGEVIIEAKYDSVVIPNPEKDVFVCYLNNETTVNNANGEQILTEYENVEAIRLKNVASDLMYEKSVLTFTSNNMVGLIDFEGKVVIEAKFEGISTLEYKEGEMIVKENDKLGVINLNGKYIIMPEYDQIQTDRYFTLEEGQKAAGYIVSKTTEEGYRDGYINNKGEEYLESKYTDISRIIEAGDESTAYLMVAEDGQYGIYKNSTKKVDFLYKSIRYDVINQFLITERAKKIGVLGLEGNEIIESIYEQIDVNGIYMYARDFENNTTVYNLKGEVQENADPDIYILNVGDRDEQIKIDSTIGLTYSIIDTNGESLTEGEYNYINYLYDDNYMATIHGGKIGIITNNEEIKIPIEYDSLDRLQDNNVIILISNEEQKAKIYNKSLEEVIVMDSQNFQYIENDGYVKLYNNTETRYIKSNGVEISNKDLFDIKIYANQKEDETWEAISKSGEVLTNEGYDKITELNEFGYLSIRKDDKWGAIDSNGNVVVEPIYTISGYKEPSFIGKYYRVEYGFNEAYYTSKIMEEQ